MILVLMLVLAALTSLLATSNLDRTRQRTLLDSALATRAQADEVLLRTLHQGITYANKQLKREDFDGAQRGVYKTVEPSRWKSDPRRAALATTSLGAATDTGFWIELFSEGATLQNTTGKHYLNCRLLISAYAESPTTHALFSQALVEAALPTLRMPTTDTHVIKVETLPEAKVIATRSLN